jgi:O-antigen/teichoic acid export membrane protein
MRATQASFVFVARRRGRVRASHDDDVCRASIVVARPSRMRVVRGTQAVHGVVVTAHQDLALRRATRVQALSLVLRAGQPVLLAFATRVHGLAAFGAFIAAQAAVFVAARVALLGLDRALLVTAPSLAREGRGVPLGRALAIVTGTSVVGACVVAAFIEASVPTADAAFIAIASVAVLPVAVVELASQVTIGRGRFASAMLIRDVLAPLLSISLVFLPSWSRGDARAYVVSFVVAMSAASFALLAPLCLDPSIALHPGRALPTRVIRVGRGALIADGVATAAQRLDVAVLALVAAPALVGAYGVLMQFANTLRALRAGLEPEVQRRVAEADATAGVRVRTAGVRREALRATLRLQLPVAFAFVVFRERALGFFGVHGDAAEVALCVLTVGHVASTFVAFEVAVLHGRGRGLEVAFVLTLGAALQLALFFSLVPQYGVVGAAFASAIAVNVPGLVGAYRRRAHERIAPPSGTPTSRREVTS